MIRKKNEARIMINTLRPAKPENNLLETAKVIVEAAIDSVDPYLFAYLPAGRFSPGDEEFLFNVAIACLRLQSTGPVNMVINTLEANNDEQYRIIAQPYSNRGIERQSKVAQIIHLDAQLYVFHVMQKYLQEVYGNPN